MPLCLPDLGGVDPSPQIASHTHSDPIPSGPLIPLSSHPSTCLTVKTSFYLSFLFITASLLPCAAISAKAHDEMETRPFEPVNRPLAEDYTGLWCGFCPRAHVALERMAATYGLDCPTVSWHSDDAMSVTDRFPSTPREFPYGFINRNQVAKPGSWHYEWPDVAEKPVTLWIGASAWLAGDDSSTLKVKSSIGFTETTDCSNLRMAYVVVADSLSDPSWIQVNHCNGDRSELPSPWGDIFYETPNYVKGLSFNSVAVAFSPFDGIEGSIPATMEAWEVTDHTWEFDLSNIKSVRGNSIPIKREYLRVVASVVDSTTGAVINSCSSVYPGIWKDPEAGCGAPAEDGIPVSTQWITPSGAVAPDGARGLLIRIDRYADGSIRAGKEIR